ncbi:hypothetical protein OIU85_002402 [Salix viminalis]|uniref:GIL1/IRKI C-terminal domain-containing protein n=1 Tax=Salix viminalis TaxID=40686 RepID=A0A9Q0ZYZ8_SALVM|nr:hypothetical protein OIU85_002402 [Salix viminalis]
MFDGFHLTNFSPQKESQPEKKNQQRLFVKRFSELKSATATEFIAHKPKSTFAKFCRDKYLQLIHPQMETSFFGSSSKRSLVNSGEFPDTSFFATFAEMARPVWLLHCLACSSDHEASIFQVRGGCRFSEVYMESVAEDAPRSSENAPEADPSVAFTVVPGFRIGKTVIRCQVYLSPLQNKGKTRIKTWHGPTTSKNEPVQAIVVIISSKISNYSFALLPSVCCGGTFFSYHSDLGHLVFVFSWPF